MCPVPINFSLLDNGLCSKRRYFQFASKCLYFMLFTCLSLYCGTTRSNKIFLTISVLPVISRLFEKIIFDQMYKYFVANKLFFSDQSGFRALHSVLTCMLKCTNDWYMNFDKGLCSLT